MLKSALRPSVRKAALALTRKTGQDVQARVLLKAYGRRCSARSFSSTSKVFADILDGNIIPTERIRNIAIIAHGPFPRTYCSLLHGTNKAFAVQLIMVKLLWWTSFYANLEPSSNFRLLSRFSLPQLRPQHRATPLQTVLLTADLLPGSWIRTT